MNAKAVRPHKLPTSEREVPFLTNTPYLFSLFLDAILIVVVGLGQLVGESLQSGNLFLLLIDGAVKVLVLLDQRLDAVATFTLFRPRASVVGKLKY